MQGIMLLLLYLIAIAFAFLFSWCMSKKIQTHEKSFLIMELPPYRIPTFKNIFQNIKNAVVPFIKTAGKFIFSMSIILWFLASFQIAEGGIQSTDSIETSIISSVGHAIEPIIKPLGYDWKIGVALLSSFAAREVFVSTLATLYRINSDDPQSIIQTIKMQVNAESSLPVFSFATVISLLLFYAFALQCMSTIAAIRRETGTWKYALFSFFIMFCLAYASALVAYQVLK
jgi:ferrous iron transport protein B